MAKVTKILITGTSGSGKSTLVQQFQNIHGVYVIPESARDIMQGKSFTDLTTIQQAIYEKQLQREEEAENLAKIQGNGVILCDRGLVDIIAYNRVLGIQVPKSWIELCQGRYNLTFILNKDDILYPFSNFDRSHIILPVDLRNQIDIEIRNLVLELDLPYVDISGSIEKRKQFLEEFFKSTTPHIEGVRNKFEAR